MLSVASDLDWSDLAQLRDHLKSCSSARGRLHRLRCLVESIHDFLAPRFVTTLTAVTVVFLAGASLPL